VTDDWQNDVGQLFNCEPRRGYIERALLRWYCTEQTEYLVIRDRLERRQPIRTSACVDHWRRGSGNGNLALNLETSNSVLALNMARTTL